MAHGIIIFVVPQPTAFLCHGDMKKNHGMVAHMAHENWWLSKALTPLTLLTPGCYVVGYRL